MSSESYCDVALSLKSIFRTRFRFSLPDLRASFRGAGCRRAWLVTTNDNRPAIDFYRALGWRLAAVHVGAIAASRRLKPEIPARGVDDVPIEDEWEFELLLDPAVSSSP